MMEDMRERIVADRPAPWIARLILRHVFPYPWRFTAATRMLQLYRHSGIQGFLRSTGLLNRIAPRMAAAEALMPEVDFQSGVTPDSFHPAEGKRRGSVAFFTGCVMNSMLGSINLSSIRLLTAAGYDVSVPGDQICCGALANHAGLRDTAREMARKNVAAFASSKFDAIIINAAGCGAMLKEYPILIDDAIGFSSKVKDISEFLVSSGIYQRLTRPINRRVGYDDPCHLIHGQGVKSEPRTLLAAIPGIELVEIEGADQCCGSAGTYNITQNDLSMQILDRKMESIAKAKLDILVTGNPGCMFQFRYGAKRAGIELEVLHPVELLAQSLD
jgi:glycolate oxidase iron-sulfur subunit